VSTSIKEKPLKTTIMTMAALALSATCALAQEKKPAAALAQPAASGDPVVVSAGGIEIRKSEFEAALKTLPAEYQSYAMGAGKKQFAEDYLRMKMLAAEGLKNGLDKDPDVIRQLNLMRENLIANAQLTRIDQSIKISDEELKKAYEAGKNDYEQVKASHILIAFKGSPALQPGKPELTEEQAKAKAEDLRKQIAAGAKFEDLAKKESDDVGSGSNGGDLGAFNRGQMVPEFEKAAFELKPGEVSAPIRTQFGYHIIKVASHDFTPFEGVKGTLEKREHQKRLQAQLDAMKTSAKPTFSDSYFAEPKPEVPPAPGKQPTKQ
jgi:parvulin-like peptidyl-prolyl isomerase